MDQQTIDKLMEIKKLYEAGILTKDEMEAEKNKVLHPEGIVSEEPKAEEPVSEEIPSDAIPDMTDREGRFVFDAPKQEPIQTNSSSTQQTGNSNKTLYWIGGIGIFAFIIVLLAMPGNKNNEPTQYYEEAPVAVDSVSYVDESVESEEQSDEVNEYDISVWEGDYIVTGGMYRTCYSMALLSFAHSEGNKFTGSIDLMLGDEDDMGRFDFMYGKLSGTVRAELTDNGTLQVYLRDYNIEEGSNGDYITPEGISGGSHIFSIDYDNGMFKVKPSKMFKSFFDGVTDYNKIVKR